MDTDTGFARTLEDALRVAGATVRVSARALFSEHLADLRVDALVVDPDVYGGRSLEHLESLRERMPLLAIVVCTGRTSVGQRVRGLRLGADAWLTKPCDADEVVARLEAVVRACDRARSHEPILAGEL